MIKTAQHADQLISIFVPGHFLGDIALPDISYSKRTKEEANFQAEVEKYKQEVLEGLQIEEEGLTDFIRKKTKQPSEPRVTSRSYNDPFDNFNSFLSNRKNGQDLKASFAHIDDILLTNKSKIVNNNNNNIKSTMSTPDITTEKTKIRHRKRHVEYSLHPKQSRTRKRYLYS